MKKHKRRSLPDRASFFFEKGRPGYRNRKLLLSALVSLFWLSVVLALLFTGLVLHHSRSNIWTVASVLACLPFAKAFVGLLVRLPYRTASGQILLQLEPFSDRLCIVYDLILTSQKKRIPVEAFVITPGHIYGYVKSPPVDPADDASFIESELISRTGRKYTVRLIDRESAFMARAKGLYRIAGTLDPSDRERKNPVVADAVRGLCSLSL